MNCTDLQRSLDEGRPDRDARHMQSHVATCVACEREFAAAMELERLLGVIVPATVRPGFNDAVMQRIHAANLTEAAIQIVANPIVPLSLAIVIVIALRVQTLRHLTTHFSTWTFTLPNVTFAMTLALAPLLLGISWLLFRTCERLTFQRR